MSTRAIPLEQFQIQTPCTQAWSTMHGDDAKRFCDKCNKHVHDLAHFDRADADALLNAQTAGHVCVRMARDEAGRVITRDYWKVAAGAALAASVGLNGCQRTQGEALPRTAGNPAHSATMGEPAPPPKVLMGDVCVPQPTMGKPAPPPPAPPLTGSPVPVPPPEPGPVR